MLTKTRFHHVATEISEAHFWRLFNRLTPAKFVPYVASDLADALGMEIGRITVADLTEYAGSDTYHYEFRIAGEAMKSVSLELVGEGREPASYWLEVTGRVDCVEDWSNTWIRKGRHAVTDVA